MRVGIIGLGLTGIVNAGALASFGHDIIAYDQNEKLIEQLQKGLKDYNEPDVIELLLTYKNHIVFTSNFSDLSNNIDILIVAIDSAVEKNGTLDLNEFYDLIDKLKREYKRNVTLLIKTAVPVGVSGKVEKYLNENNKTRFDVAYQSEILFAQTAVSDFFHTTRLVVGTSSLHAHMTVNLLYEQFLLRDIFIYFTTLECAELTRYTALNIMLIENSFINEMSDVCHYLNIDSNDLNGALGIDYHLSRKRIELGMGLSGSNFPTNPQNPFFTPRLHSKMCEIAMKINKDLPMKFVNILKNKFQNLNDLTIGIIGLSSYRTTKNIANTQAINLIHNLLEQGAKVIAYDDTCQEIFKTAIGKLKNLKFASDLRSLLRKSDCVVLMNKCQEFMDYNEEALLKYMKCPIIYDIYNVLYYNEFKSLEYHPSSSF